MHRPLAGRANLVIEPVQVGAVARPVLHIAASEQGGRTLELGPLAAGDLRVFLAPEPGTTGFALAELRLQGEGLLARLLADEPSLCRQSWEAVESGSPGSDRARPEGWRECRLTIPRGVPSARLTIRFEGGARAGLMVSSPVAVPASLARRPPVFVLLIDTVRKDVLRSYDGTRAGGGGFARLARDSLVFEDLRAPSSWTRTSVAGLFTGLSPAQHKVYDRLDVLGADLPSLPSFLQDAGYLTSAWSSNPNVLPMWGFARGFDVFTDVGSHAWAKDKADAAEVFALVEKAVLAEVAVPGFFYIHLMDAHAPYTPPDDLLREVKADESLVGRFPVPIGAPDVAKVWFAYQRYVAEVRDLDREIARFLEFLDGAGLYDPSVILVVSDHGEEFLDHYGIHHGKTLYDEVIQAPAFLKLPDRRLAGTRLGAPAELTDMFATLAEALALPAPESLEGSSALGFADRPRPQVSELILDGRRLASLTFDGWKLIVDHKSGQKRLFDLSKDPRESVDVAGRYPERVRELGRTLNALTTRHLPGWHLRACGCARRQKLEVKLEVRHGEPRPVSLESSDSIQPFGEGAYRLGFDLDPRLARREALGAMIAVSVFDEDEVAIAPPARLAGASRGAGTPSGEPFGLALTAEGTSPLAYALGAGPVEHASGRLSLDPLAERARVRGGRPIDCRATVSRPPAKADEQPCTPFVRIWRVEPPESVPAAALDPSVAERLRALGYAW